MEVIDGGRASLERTFFESIFEGKRDHVLAQTMKKKGSLRIVTTLPSTNPPSQPAPRRSGEEPVYEFPDWAFVHQLCLL